MDNNFDTSINSWFDNIWAGNPDSVVATVSILTIAFFFVFIITLFILLCGCAHKDLILWVISTVPGIRNLVGFYIKWKTKSKYFMSQIGVSIRHYLCTPLVVTSAGYPENVVKNGVKLKVFSDHYTNVLLIANKTDITILPQTFITYDFGTAIIGGQANGLTPQTHNQFFLDHQLAQKGLMINPTMFVNNLHKSGWQIVLFNMSQNTINIPAFTRLGFITQVMTQTYNTMIYHYFDHDQLVYLVEATRGRDVNIE